MPSIKSSNTVFSTPWFSLLSKTLTDKGGEEFYSLQTDDYCCLIGLTQDQRIVLVRQFRPAVESVTLELPAGHVDKGEKPREAAIREFTEETGYKVDVSKVVELGSLFSDTGRLTNRSWYFLARDVTLDPNAKLEEGIEVVLVPVAELKSKLCNEFSHSMHVGALTLAMLRENITL